MEVAVISKKDDVDASAKKRNLPTGYAEEVALSHSTFKTQHQRWDNDGRNLSDLPPKPKRQKRGDPSIVDGEGAYKGPWAKYEEEVEEVEEELGSDEEYIEEETAVVPANLGAMTRKASHLAVRGAPPAM